MQEEASMFAHCPEECAEEWQGKKTEHKGHLVPVLIIWKFCELWWRETKGHERNFLKSKR